MKYYCLIAFLFLTSFHFAAAQPEDQLIPHPKADDVAKGAFQESLLLEISLESFAMGRRWKSPLYFRLYENGRLDYEVEQKSNSANGPGTIYVKREIQLRAADLEELIKLAEEPDFLSARDAYPSLARIRDASRTTKVFYSHRGREKRITISDYSPQSPKAESFYPKSLVKLLDRVRELRPKD